MPRYKPIVINCAKLLRHDKLDSMMFGYVIGVTNILPSVPITKALELFMRDFNLSEDEYSMDSAMNMYYKMFKEFRVYHLNEINKKVI